MIEYLFAFLLGGTITALITFFEASGSSTLSGLAALFPIFTWVSYLFIGKISGAAQVSRHSLFVLLGTLFAWVPYMFIIYYYAPKIGVIKAVLLAMVVFLLLAAVYIKLYGKV